MASSSAAAGTWENWTASWEFSHTANIKDDFMEEGEEANYDQFEPDAAGAELADVLVELKLGGKLSATQVGIIAYWAAKAGAVGPAANLDCLYTATR